MDGEKVTEVTVERGSNKILTITADEGYKIISVKVNDIETELNNGVLELKDIQQDQNIVVQTEKVKDESNNEVVEDVNNTTANEIEENITNTEDVKNDKDTNKDITETIDDESKNLNEEKTNDVKKTKNPQTGDNILLNVITFSIAMIGVIVIYKEVKK